MSLLTESAQVSLYLHATEDFERVLNSVSSVLGVQREAFRTERVEGHFGNVITVCNANLESEDAAKLLSRTFESLNGPDRLELSTSLEGRIERDMFLHLRLDKQELVLGRVKLGDSDPVKLRFRFARGTIRLHEALRMMIA